MDAGAVALGIENYFGRVPGVLFAVALIDACIIGAAAASPSTTYALGDVFTIEHSDERPEGRSLPVPSPRKTARSGWGSEAPGTRGRHVEQLEQ